MKAMAVLLLLLILSQVNIVYCLNYTDQDLGELIQHLQAELAAVQQAQQEDKQLILQLQEKLLIRHNHHHRKTKPPAVPCTTSPSVSLTDAVQPKITEDELERERTNIIKLEREISDLKKDFLQVLSEQESRAVLNIKLEEYRQEIIALQDQLKLVNLEISKIKEVQERSAASPVNQLKFYNTGIKFLQKRVDDLRTEVLAFSEAHNNSATQGQLHHLQSTINRLRMDLLSLQNNFEELTIAQEHDLSTVIYLQRELSEFGQQMTRLTQTVTSNQQVITQLKENLSVHILTYTNNLALETNKNDDEEEDIHLEEMENVTTTTYTPEIETAVGMLTVTKTTSEMETTLPPTTTEELVMPLPISTYNVNISTYNESITISTTTMINNHSNGDSRTVKHRRELQLEISHLKKDLENLMHDYQLLEIRCTSHGTAIQQQNNAQTNLSYQMSELEEKLRYLENRTLENVRQDQFQSIVRNMIVHLAAIDQQEQDNDILLTNLTSRVANFEKLDALFRGLTNKFFSLEEEYSASISSLQKNIDSVENALSQMKGMFSHLDSTQEVKQELLGLQTKVVQFGYKLTTVQNNVLNMSLQSCKDENHNLLQDAKLSHLEVATRKHSDRMDKYDGLFPQIRNAMNFKVDVNSMKQLVIKAEQLEDRMDNTTKELPQFLEQIERMNQEMLKFIQQLPTDCMMNVPSESALYHSGVYLIHPEGSNIAYEVYCDMDQDDEGWTVIQRRLDGSVDFFRTWEDYKKGFGDVHGEYWLGNDIIHLLTNQDNYSLFIQMWDTYDEYTWAKYDYFQVRNESENYRIFIDSYNGNSSDALAYHNNMLFSTKDYDNDASSSHCAMFYVAGWWYSHCQYTNLNGDYKIGITWYDKDVHVWRQMKKVIMKIRPGKVCISGNCR